MSSATQVLTRKPQNVAIETNPAHELNLVDAETPEPGPNECLVHVRATGICGSDVHFWKEGRIGSSIIDRPVGLGHESAGVVVKLGSQCQRLKVGMSSSSSSRCRPPPTATDLVQGAKIVSFSTQAIVSPWNAECPVPNQPARPVVPVATTPAPRSSSIPRRLTLERSDAIMRIRKPGYTSSQAA